MSKNRISQGFDQGQGHDQEHKHNQGQTQSQTADQSIRIISLSKPASDLYENAINLFDAIGMNSELSPRITIQETDQSEQGTNYDNKQENKEQQFSQSDLQLNNAKSERNFIDVLIASNEQTLRILEGFNVYAEEHHIKTLNDALNNHEEDSKAPETFISLSLADYLKINEQLCGNSNEADLTQDAKIVAQIRKVLMTRLPVKGIYASCYQEYRLVMIEAIYESLMSNIKLHKDFNPKTKTIFEQAKSDLGQPLLILHLEKLIKLAKIEWCECVNHSGPKLKRGVQAASGVKKKLKCTEQEAEIVFTLWKQIPKHLYEEFNNESKASYLRMNKESLNKNRVPEVTVEIIEGDENQYGVDIVYELKQMERVLDERIQEDLNRKLLYRYKYTADNASQLKELMYLIQYLKVKDENYLSKILGLSVNDQKDIRKTIESLLAEHMSESDLYVSKKYQTKNLNNYDQGYDSAVELLKEMHQEEPGIIMTMTHQLLYALKKVKKTSEYIEKYSQYQLEQKVLREKMQTMAEAKHEALAKAGKLTKTEKENKPKVANINKTQHCIKVGIKSYDVLKEQIFLKPKVAEALARIQESFLLTKDLLNYRQVYAKDVAEKMKQLYPKVDKDYGSKDSFIRTIQGILKGLVFQVNGKKYHAHQLVAGQGQTLSNKSWNPQSLSEYQIMGIIQKIYKKHTGKGRKPGAPKLMRMLIKDYGLGTYLKKYNEKTGKYEDDYKGISQKTVGNILKDMKEMELA